MDRRKFLRTTAATAALAAMPRTIWADDENTVPARLTIQPGNTGQPIAKNFLGLSYEAAQLSQPEFFSPQNTGLAGFMRALGTGVLRIGGNSSEYAFWTPNVTQGMPTKSSTPIGPDPGHKAPPPTLTTPEAIRNLRQFLDLTGWRAMYGLNFGQGTPKQAAEEAAFVSQTLGDRLISFQIGNEDDLFPSNGLRPKGYSYSDFAGEWKTFYDAVKARVPGARFAGPDTAGTSDWLTQFAQQFGNDIVELSTHYYALGPISDPSMNIQRLLSPNPRWEDGVPKIQQAMRQSHLPYRLTETNSCYGGGKPDVSNTFASSLWALDLMFQLLAIGGSGINFHGGGYGWYAPVVGTVANGFVARPEYYSMLLMSQLIGATLVPSRLETREVNPLFAAYALTSVQGKQQAVVINKDAQQNIRLTLQANANAERINIQRLIAPRLEDQQDTTLAAAPVGANGAWKPERIGHAGVARGRADVLIPAGSAALLSWQ